MEARTDGQPKAPNVGTAVLVNGEWGYVYSLGVQQLLAMYEPPQREFSAAVEELFRTIPALERLWTNWCNFVSSRSSDFPRFDCSNPLTAPVAVMRTFLMRHGADGKERTIRTAPWAAPEPAEPSSVLFDDDDGDTPRAKRRWRRTVAVPTVPGTHVQLMWDMTRVPVAWLEPHSYALYYGRLLNMEVAAEVDRSSEPAYVDWEAGTGGQWTGWFTKKLPAHTNYVTIERESARVVAAVDPFCRDHIVSVQCQGRLESGTYDIQAVLNHSTSNRMHQALAMFARNEERRERASDRSESEQRLALRKRVCDPMPSDLIDAVLGRGLPMTRDATVCERITNAPCLPRLNAAQEKTVRSALSSSPLTLLQGPPGTGKTTTAAQVVFNIAKRKSGFRILICAPSNTAVDSLTEAVERTGLSVLRVWSQTRLVKHQGGTGPPVSRNLLHEMVAEKFGGKPGFENGDPFKNAEAIEFARDTIQKFDVLAMTCSVAGDQRLWPLRCTHVVVDEAAQASEPEVLVALTLGCDKVVLCGDPCQLGAQCESGYAAARGLGRSLLERLLVLGHPHIQLQDQYRMKPDIASWPGTTFYTESIRNDQCVMRRGLERPWDGCSSVNVFIHASGQAAMAHCREDPSFYNTVEADIIVRRIGELIAKHVRPMDIGAITPYDAQRRAIMEALRDEGIQGVEVSTVDGFQGREKDYIVLSCVRSTDTGGIGFLSDFRRLNVALTRAKCGLLVVGDATNLVRSELWLDMLQSYRRRDALIGAEGEFVDIPNLDSPEKTDVSAFEVARRQADVQCRDGPDGRQVQCGCGQLESSLIVQHGRRIRCSTCRQDVAWGAVRGCRSCHSFRCGECEPRPTPERRVPNFRPRRRGLQGENRGQADEVVLPDGVLARLQMDEFDTCGSSDVGFWGVEPERGPTAADQTT